MCNFGVYYILITLYQPMDVVLETSYNFVVHYCMFDTTTDCTVLSLEICHFVC